MRRIFREDAAIVGKIHDYFAASAAEANGRSLVPEAAHIAEMTTAAFWSSLYQEEGRRITLSLAYVPPSRASREMLFATPLALVPKTLAKIAPAVERPGIHLGVWPDANGALRVWGATLGIPVRSMVLEVVAPGQIVVKHRIGRQSRKFVNVAVVAGEDAKFILRRREFALACQTLIDSLFGAMFDRAKKSRPEARGTVFVDLALSMRAHGHGGTLLVVPAGDEAWRASIAGVMQYSAESPYGELRRRVAEQLASPNRGRAKLVHAVETVAGFTAVDGATVITDALDVIGFGAKILRRSGQSPVEHVLVTEPVEGDTPHLEPVATLGGTRHLSAAQFVQDQPDALAMVASQDGRFTVFGWSECDSAVQAQRIDVLLL